MTPVVQEGFKARLRVAWLTWSTTKGDFQLSSPCSHLELPQTLLEPVLIRYASQHGFPCRFGTQLLSFDDSDAKSILAEVQDRIFGTKQTIKCKYLFGADGAKSRIVEDLQLPMSIKPSQGVALNVLVRADLSNMMSTRTGNLHYVIRPDVDMPEFAAWSIMRMVKPWYEWLIVLMEKPTCPADFMPSRDQIQEHIKAVIGDDGIDAEVLRIDKWIINETVAERYDRGRMSVVALLVATRLAQLTSEQILPWRRRSSASTYEWTRRKHVYSRCSEPSMEDSDG